ncbi:MAG: peptidase S8 [Acidobacteria bacterium]|nr:MAG: peptidase S8 [Acidobacteriota bacterium]
MHRTIRLLAWPALAAVLALAGHRPPLKADEVYRVASIRVPERGFRAYQPDNVIVQFKDGVRDRDAEDMMREAGGRRARRSSFGFRYLVNLDDGFAIAGVLERFRTMPGVDYAETNGIVRAFQQRVGYFTPADPFYKSQWHFLMLDAERTWGIQKGDPSVVVAVLDSGIAFEDFGKFRKAPDFGSTVFVKGFNVFTSDEHANDDNFHGTHVASTVAESTDNNVGVAGLAFGCALMPVKVLDSEGVGSFFDVAEGMDYATNFTQNGQHPVKVINLSLGGDTASNTMRQAVDRAVGAGITVVAAAGNDSAGKISFPAALSNVIAVGAVDGRKVKAPYSNFGPELSVVAPGGDLRRDDTGPDGVPDGRPDGVLQQTFDPDTAANQGRYDDFHYFFVVGTSQATPHVAAVAALLYRQGITQPAAVKAAIESTAEDLGAPGRDDMYGHGLIRPALALRGYGLNE